MTTSATQVDATRRGERFFLAGWICVGIFGVIVVVAHGWDELPFAVVLAGVALAMCVWYRLSSGKAVAVVGLVLGALLTVQQLAYLVSDLGSRESMLGKTLPDTLGLIAAALIVIGAGLDVVPRRRSS